MIPPKEELEEYRNLIEEAADKFNVSERTIRRWFARYHIEIPNNKNRPNKISADQAEDIRIDFSKGVSAKSLALQHEVTLASIYRVLGHKTHKRNKPTANVFVVYNPL